VFGAKVGQTSKVLETFEVSLGVFGLFGAKVGQTSKVLETFEVSEGGKTGYMIALCDI
jgi:hypothetical protein